jgi:Cys-tRNA(Pro)/Cys-tRNA(Cys) deacylase
VKKTQAIRALEARGVAYRAVEYDSSGAFHTGEEAAILVGAAVETVFKTLVVLREGDPRAKPLLVMAPVARELDLKLVALEVGAKRLRMATQKEAERLTGMQVGGISALGAQRRERFEVVIDESARRLERVHVSAGARGVDLELAVEDLVAVTGARYVQAVA